MLGFAIGRVLFGVILKPLLALLIIPLGLSLVGSCSGAKAELRRSQAAHRETIKRMDDLAFESGRLKNLADRQRARADANKAWALEEEAKPCPDSCLLPDY